MSKINILSLNNKDENKSNEYSHFMTISALSKFCYGIMKLRKVFKQIKYTKDNITDEDIINSVFELLFRDDSQKIEIAENIRKALIRELIEVNKRIRNEYNKNYEKYFFENSESLKNFVL